MWFISFMLSWPPSKLKPIIVAIMVIHDNMMIKHIWRVCPVCEFVELHSLRLGLCYDLTRSHQFCKTCHCRVKHQTGCSHNLLIPFNEGEIQHELFYTQLWLWRILIWICLLYVKCQEFSFFHVPFIYYFSVSFSIAFNNNNKKRRKKFDFKMNQYYSDMIFFLNKSSTCVSDTLSKQNGPKERNRLEFCGFLQHI